MLTQREQEEIRHGIENSASYSDDDSPTADALRAWGKVAVRDAPRLLAALQNAEEEIARLKVLVGKLYKIVNLASLTKCDHKCFTKETQGHLLALLEEARAVVEQRKISPTSIVTSFVAFAS